jgi:hypothetical protein
MGLVEWVVAVDEPRDRRRDRGAIASQSHAVAVLRELARTTRDLPLGEAQARGRRFRSGAYALRTAPRVSQRSSASPVFAGR